eukprot:1192612-Prorocentrum_minimum.AAC.1
MICAPPMMVRIREAWPGQSTRVVWRGHREPGKSQIQCDPALRALRVLVQRRSRQQRAESAREAGFPTVYVPQNAHIHVER